MNYSVFVEKKCLRSYPGESTRSHLNSEVKHLWARLVEWWVTTFESLVLQTFFFFFFFLMRAEILQSGRFNSIFFLVIVGDTVRGQ